MMLTNVNNRQVEYEKAGRGIPLVLIHGYPLSRKMWDEQLKSLSEVAQVIVPDLPGFGGSGGLVSPEMSSYAEFIHDLLASLQVTEPAVICGLSMGGYVVFEYFRRYPGHVRGLILANTKAGPDSAEAQAGRDKSAGIAREQGAGAIANAMLPKMFAPQTYNAKPELLDQVKNIMLSATVQGIVDALMAMRNRPDSTPTLAQIRQPTLVITGAEDQLMPTSESKNMAEKLGNSRLEMLPSAGHLSNMEQPDGFNRAVRDYLRTV